VTIEIDSKSLPIIPGVLEIASTNTSGGMNTNKKHFAPGIEFQRDVPDALRDLIFDPQTSGGLLLSVAAESADRVMDNLKKAGIQACFIGTVIADTGKRLRIG